MLINILSKSLTPGELLVMNYRRTEQKSQNLNNLVGLTAARTFPVNEIVLVTKHRVRVLLDDALDV